MHQFIHLLKQQKIDKNDVNELESLFNKLDSNYDGMLSYGVEGQNDENNSKKLH